MKAKCSADIGFECLIDLNISVPLFVASKRKESRSGQRCLCLKESLKGCDTNKIPHERFGAKILIWSKGFWSKVSYLLLLFQGVYFFDVSRTFTFKKLKLRFGSAWFRVCAIF